MSGLTAASLFAGIGGFDLALERADVEVVAAVEIDPDCRGVLANRFPRTRLFNDVTEVAGDQLRAAGFVPGRGVLTAGWPCQGNSVAGRRGGLADPRSGLWRHVVRLLAETRPRWFVGENVPGLLSVNGGRDFGTVIRDLDELGYGLAWRILDAQWFGVPQRRRRVFVVGCLGNPCGPVQVLLEPESGSGDLAASRETGPGTSGAPGEGIVGTLGTSGPGGGWRVGADEAAAGQLVAVSALQGGGRRGHWIDAEGAAGGHLIALPVAWRGRDGGSQLEAGADGAPAFALRSCNGGSSMPMVATLGGQGLDHALTSAGADASEDGTGRGTPIVAYALTSHHNRDSDSGQTYVTEPMAFNPQTGGTKGRIGYGDKPTALQANQITAVQTSAAVRRLSPLECERLQGFPDYWTLRLADGTEQSDSARYRQLGNSVAVPVIEWIVRRIVAVATQAEAGTA